MIRKYLRKIEKAQSTVVGINRRNIEFIYPNNNREDYRIADDKALCKTLLQNEKIPVPETYTLIEHLWEVDEKLLVLDTLENFVVKPSMGSGGNGILILQKHAGGWITPDGSPYNRERLIMHMAGILYGAYSQDHADKVIVEERLVPHPFFSDIYEKGIPDIRVIVKHDNPVMAMLRIPTRISKGKANLHQGATGIGIEMESGRLGYGTYKNRRITAHPDSGVEFRGLVIPQWKEMVTISKNTAGLVPLKFLGIDIILDAQTGPLVIEINARPGLQIQNSNSMGLLEALEKRSGNSV
ncbi:MAG: sugar-transfer associated ATP-grasp domain-containing protein [Bacteroidota bacterium]